MFNCLFALGFAFFSAVAKATKPICRYRLSGDVADMALSRRNRFIKVI
jgi:hypothetical protein